MSHIKINPCGGPELPTGSAMVPPPGPEVTGATSGTGVSKTPTTDPSVISINTSPVIHSSLPPFSSFITCPFPTRVLRSASTNTASNASPENISIPSVNRTIPVRTSNTPSSTTKNNVLCKACNKLFKGRRGLNIHLGRSAARKQTIRPQSTPPEDAIDDQSIPQAVRDSIKSPSTCVEDLEHKCGDGSNTKITFHNSKNGCKMCHVLSTKDHFVSSATHRIYKSEIPASISKIDCNSCNLIYLITCRKCALQYVGETCQKIRDRFRIHNACMGNPDKDQNCRILSEHFNKGSCKGAAYSVNIIEKLEGDGRDENGKLDPSMTTIRRKKETQWMLKLRTVFPYGLNDRVGNEYMTDRGNSIISTQFPSLKRHNNHFRVRTKNYVSRDLIIKHFPYIVMESIKTNRRNTMNLIRVLLSSLAKADYKKLGDIINDYLINKYDDFLFSQFFLAALDIILGRVWKSPTVVKQKVPSKHRININFCNKGVDFINLPQILNNPDLVSLLPSPFNKDLPMVVFNLEKPIRSKIFNYKTTVQDIDVEAFLEDPSILPCSCADSPFKDPHHGHIITGDLSIVNNNKLRKLISKGPKFRENEGICWTKTKESILKGINESTKKWLDSKGLPSSLLLEWKAKFLELVDNTIDSLKEKVKPRKITKTLNDSKVKDCLKKIHNNFVMVPIDKADSNVAFVCKRYYIEVITKELGLDGNPSDTYEHLSDTDANNIINIHKEQLSQQFNLKTPADMHSLPDIYWLPKLHKTPVKSRFIIASQKCTIKKLSKDLTSIFKLAYEQVERYNNKASVFSGIKTFWVIQNSQPVMSSLNRINTKHNAKTLSSFDFSTLYTKIPHSKLLEELSAIIKFIFKGGTRNTISINRHGVANWSKHVDSSSNYNLDKILKGLKYLLDNCYFKLGNKLFRQIIGIPMGSDPAPYFANLFLYRYESRWLTKMKKENNVLARKFGNVFRYIDDLIAINDGEEFQKHFPEIYPDELELKKENTINTDTNFLELNIKILNSTFHTKLYDKRDAFGFQICRLPFKGSNIPKRMFYASASAEGLRICRATSDLHNAVGSMKLLMARMLKQGAVEHLLKTSLTKIFNKHNISTKYNTTTIDFINMIF